MILVDNPKILHKILYKGAPFYHMTSTISTDELHKFAKKLGLKKEWFQRDKHYHYDISHSKYLLAIKLGAKIVDSRIIVKEAKKLYENNKI
jgi:hypothetical protein